MLWSAVTGTLTGLVVVGFEHLSRDVGGLFIPLAAAGSLLGRAFEIVVHGAQGLFPIVGVAAFLGAGYWVPLAAVMFIAEATGRPGFVVPGLIAAVAAELVMGRSTVADHQVDAYDSAS